MKDVIMLHTEEFSKNYRVRPLTSVDADIGFFMMNEKYQGRGEGSKIIQELLEKLLETGFEYVRLGYMKGNEQSRAFWEKNGFIPTGVETDNGQGIIVVMQKELRKN